MRLGQYVSNWICSKHRSSQRGVTSIEYALIASLIAIVIVGSISAAGGENNDLWAHWTGEVVAALKLVLGD